VTFVREPLDIFRVGARAERRAATDRLIEAVGLGKEAGERYPHEFSGGQRHRINIARALALQPLFVVCDEPVSALDVRIQAQIIDLLLDLQDEFGLTYLFISHDLAVVREICHRVGIMYLGALCEVAASDDIYAAPLHPYTRALISAAPIPDPVAEANRARIVLSGEVPNAIAPPQGCRFSGRCPARSEVPDRFGIDCATVAPALAEVGRSHRVACHLYEPSRSG
jgi:oligopeptide/dipeptide ABC transporter ATP-binding protein